MPASALANFGLSFTTSVLATMRSMISPGIFEEFEHLVRVGGLKDGRDDRLPRHHRRHVRRLEGGGHVGVGRVDDLEVLFLCLDALERARQQIMRHGKLDEIDLLAEDILELFLVLEDHRVVAVGEVADDDGRGVDAAGGGNRQRVHVGDGHGVEGAGGKLIDQLDVVVELLDLDIDAVFVGPFFHDARLGGIAPRHPADIDRPGDFEIFLLGGERRRDEDARDRGGGEQTLENLFEGTAHRYPLCAGVDHISRPASGFDTFAERPRRSVAEACPFECRSISRV